MNRFVCLYDILLPIFIHTCIYVFKKAKQNDGGMVAGGNNSLSRSNFLSLIKIAKVKTWLNKNVYNNMIFQNQFAIKIDKIQERIIKPSACNIHKYVYFTSPWGQNKRIWSETKHNKINPM